ncbi:MULTISPECIES: flagellar protein FlaG [Shewanella]|uniref:flagellar protein FlaG n=1 Tax=Shewanella TaxID=22 RepID=UPI001BBB8862|nr:MULTISPECIES: flagellar protein FlaG [Shewanella]GIU53332.1 flagella locus protein FlaG [Shewanella sp. KT0246]
MAIDINLTGAANTHIDNLGTRQLTDSNAQAEKAQLKVSELSKTEQQSEKLADKAIINQKAKDEKLAEFTEELNNIDSLVRKGLAFKLDEDSGQNVISVMDIDSGDIIRQIPNEEALELSKKMAEVAGLLLNTEA